MGILIDGRNSNTEIQTKNISPPLLTQGIKPIDLSDETMEEPKNQLLSTMKKQQLDVVIIYADREHGANFEYFTGFIPRFEEALLVVHQNGKAVLLLGNENSKMVNYTRIPASLVHVPFFHFQINLWKMINQLKIT